MTKTQALYEFFNRFDVLAYPATSVPEKVAFPYITYEVKTGSFGSLPVSIGAKLWYHTESESIPNAKAEEIGKHLGEGGVTITCDDGFLWIRKGDPFCITQNAENDDSIKLRFLNLYVEYITL